MKNLKDKFLLNKKICFLNFGSFGACPKEVFDDYQNWQRILEYQPVDFLAKNFEKNLAWSRSKLAEYLNCQAENLVYVSNPTSAVNIVAKNLFLKEKDEILTTNLEYGACDMTWSYYASKNKFIYNKQKISLPITSKEELVKEFYKGLTPNTKAIFFSHITSSTALILPAKELISKAKEHGLITIVDGAHAPGHIHLDLAELGADFYIGACHKWMMAPKGSSFLVAKKSFHSILDPLVISWNYKLNPPSSSVLVDYHQLQGTRDISAYLSVPAAIKFRDAHNWQDVSNQCKILVKDRAGDFVNLLKTKLISPLNDDFIGQMLSLPLKTKDPLALKEELYKFNIEIPVFQHSTGNYLRYSINGFNSSEDLDYLYNSLKKIIQTSTIIEN